MKQLIYSFFIILLILFLKIKVNIVATALLIFLIILLLFKKLYLELFLALLVGLTLNPKLKDVNWNKSISGIVVKRGDFYLVAQTVKGKILVYSNQRPKINSFIKFSGNPKLIKKENSPFNPKIYWNSKGINYQIKNPKFYNIKLDTKNPSYLKSWFNLVLFNEKDKTTKLIYKNFQELGLAHIIVISSFHITLLYAMLYFLKRKYRFLIVFIFCLISGFGPPAQKALLFLFLINIFPKKPKIEILSWVGIIILILAPWSSRDYSFIFTMVFSFAILLSLSGYNKITKVISLRIIGSYIQWLFTSSIYVINFFTVILSPLVFLLYIAIMLRQIWFLKFVEAFLEKLNKINVPLVIGQSTITMIFMPFLIMILIKNLNLFHKSIKNTIFYISATLIFTKLYLSTLSFVTFLNVGQGDSAVIKLKHKVYLIDVGKPGSFNKIIKPYLFKYGVSKIENIYISHGDLDHIGGMQDNFKGIRVLKNKNQLFKSINNKSWGNKNDNSKVILFNHNNKSFLFTGDISQKVEKYIANQIHQDIDILKVSHHGSKTSSSNYFLSKLYPSLAIISVGKNNYGHPHSDVIARLKAHNVKIKTTLKDGHIKIML